MHDETFAALFAKRPQEIKPGLTRIQAGWRELEFPSRDIPCVLVGGTNGKGSTSGFLFALMAASLRELGLYTSPHLVHFSERIQCGHHAIDDGILVQEWRELQKELSPLTYQSLSFFEVTTLLAMRVFARQQCVFNIFEVGLGGRWDATNVLEPLASIIVSLGHDHEAWLGGEITSIAREKLGICREGRPLFWGHCPYLTHDAAVRALVEKTVADKKIPLWYWGRHFGGDGESFYIELPHRSPMREKFPHYFEDLPAYLRSNFVLAAAYYHWLANTPWGQERLCPLVDALGRFAAEPRLPPHMSGRFQRLEITDQGRKFPVLIDVGHNVDGVEALVQGLQACYPASSRPFPGIVSILKDKNINGMLDILRGILDPLVLFKLDHERTLTRDDLEERHRQLPLMDTFDDAWKFVVNRPLAVGPSRPILVCGSVLAVGQVLEQWGVQPGWMHAGAQQVGQHDCKDSGNV